MRQRGAALLTAMLTVTLVASFAAAALWQQWRSVEIESAERSRAQMQWVLNGALDWARLILREDARNGEVDHLSEPWALPLQEARLASFLAVAPGQEDDAMQAYLSGQISDQQALLNVRNLVQAGQPNPAAQQAFGRLFAMLHIPPGQLQLLVTQLQASERASQEPSTSPKAAQTEKAPLAPQRLEQLVWLGLPQSTVRALAPYATLLPVPTPVNLNTAGAEVLEAVLPGLEPGQARLLVARRASGHFRSVQEALQAAGLANHAATQAQVQAQVLAVGSRFFAVRGRLRLGSNALQEVSLVERSGTSVRVVWRQHEALAVTAGPSLQ